MKTAMQWINSASKENDVEFILSTDKDDSQKSLYYLWSENQISSRVRSFSHITGDNKNVVDAMNAGAKVATGQILICISDDFYCPNHWDKLIVSAGDWTEPLALKVNDTITAADNKVLTLPIISRALYQKLGYVYYPQYTGMWADNDLAELASEMGCLKVRHDLVFPHKHWVNGQAPKDPTYNRHNTTQSWNIGTALIEKRRKEHFAA